MEGSLLYTHVISVKWYNSNRSRRLRSTRDYVPVEIIIMHHHLHIMMQTLHLLRSQINTTPLHLLSTTCLPCPTTSESTATDHNYQPNDGVVNKTLYKCRKCKLLFWTTRDAALHEQNCTDTKWHNCPVCMVLRFRTQEEVEFHKRTCEGVSIYIDFMFYMCTIISTSHLFQLSPLFEYRLCR